MRTLISRWFLFGLLIGWALTHATVFGQSTAGRLPAADKMRQGLDKVITVDYTGQSLVEVLNHLRDKTGLPIDLDQYTLLQMGLNPGEPAAPVHVKATNEKASQVLRKLLNTQRLCYVVFEDSLLVTTEDMAAVRQFRQRVSVDLEDVACKKAVRDLAKTHGINLVIDPKVALQVETPVSLQLDNTGIETTVRLLAELANLKAVRMGNVMFITSEEKAKKIREEEPHQFDNPLNPNVAAQPLAIGGGFGLGGGARALPALPPIAVDPAPPAPEVPVAPQVVPVESKKPANPDDPVKPVKKVIDIRPPQAPAPPPPVPPAFERSPLQPAPVPRQNP